MPQEVDDELLDTADAPQDVGVSPQPARGPRSAAAKMGLPEVTYRVDFQRFVDYNRSLTPEQRRNVIIRVYRLFPKINLRFLDAKAHVNIDKVGGEYPYGGESGPAEEDVLSRYGLGDYQFKLNYVSGSTDRTVCEAWLTGYKDNLPGFRDFQNHPPLIPDMRAVVVDDERNNASGYITYLRGAGQIPGAAAKENEEDMADQAANAAAVGVLGKLAERAFDNREAPTPAAPTNPDPGAQFLLETVKDTINTVNDIHKQNAVPNTDPVALIDKLADVLRPPAPDNTILNGILAQNLKMHETVSDLHVQRADDLKDQLNGLRQDMRHMMDRATAPPPVSASTPTGPVDPFESFVSTLERVERIKGVLGVKPPDEDDGAAPRRRRRNPDEDDEPAGGGKSVWASMAENLPTIMGMGLSLINGISLAIHNGRVLATGQGETVAPDMPGMAGAVDQSRNPAFAAQPQYHNVPVAALPPGGGGPQPTPTGAPTVQTEVANFLQRIEPGLLRAFDRGRTGYEYAETFIEAYGRAGGMFAYNGLKAAGTLGVPLDALTLPVDVAAFDRLPQADWTWARNAVSAIAYVLRMYAPIWSRIGADARLAEFLAEFVTYDELLKDNNAVDLMALVTQFDEVSTVQQALDAIDAGDDGDGGDEGDGGEGATIDLKADGPVVVPPVVKVPRAVKTGKGGVQ